MYMNLCIRIYIHIYIYTYTHIQMYVCTRRSSLIESRLSLSRTSLKVPCNYYVSAIG